MAQDTLSSGDDYYESNLVPEGSETGNSILALEGDDTVIGNGYNDLIIGDDGNDWLDGAGGDDILIGDDGNDTLLGGSDDDFLHGGNNDDILYGGTGTDSLLGGAGNDTYYYYKSDGGIDTVNDDKSPALVPGYGGGTDVLRFGDVVSSDLWLGRINDDLYVSDVADLADGIINTGVRIEDFFLGGDNVVEYVFGSDDLGFDLTSLIA